MPNGDGSLPLCGLNGVIQRLSAVHENRFKKTRKSETESADRSGALDYFFREFDTGGTKIRRFKTLGVFRALFRRDEFNFGRRLFADDHFWDDDRDPAAGPIPSARSFALRTAHRRRD